MSVCGWSQQAIIVLWVSLPMCWGCASPQTPEVLTELRRSVNAPTVDVAREAAPDLVAEAERSLAAAEVALEHREGGRARRLSVLGVIQLNLAQTEVRQQAAGARVTKARRGTREIEEDLARYESMRADIEAAIRRLEVLGASRELPAAR